MTLPKQVSKGVLKANMLKYFREIERTGQELIITDHHQPILKISALKRPSKNAQAIFKPYRSRLVYHEDITTPTTEVWQLFR